MAGRSNRKDCATSIKRTELEEQMKRLFIVLAVLLLPLVLCAQTATTRIDTIKTPAYTGDAGKYSATWEITLSTANDTLRPPWPATQVIVIHKGATSGDT